MKILVLSVPNKSLRQEIASKDIKSRIWSIPNPLSTFLFVLWLRSETYIRYIGCHYSSILISKLTLRELFSLIRNDHKGLFKVITGISILYCKNQDSYRAILNYLNEKEARVHKYWLSRELLLECQDPIIWKSQIEDLNTYADIYFLKFLSRRVTRKSINQRIEYRRIKDLDPVDTEKYQGELVFEEIKNGIVENGAFVTVEKKYILPTTPYSEEELSRDFPSIIPTTNGLGSALVVQTYSKRILRDGIFVGSNPNYYHNMWENIPRILLYFKQNGKQVPPILPYHLPRQIVEIYQHATGVQPVICNPLEALNVENLIVARDWRYESRVDYRQSKKQNIFETRRDDLTLLRNFINGLDIEPPKENKYFVSLDLDHARNPSNSKDLISLMEKLDFRVIKPTQLDFKSQVGIFQEAKFMVIMTGAAVTNLAFSRNLNHVIFIIGATKSDEAAKLFWPQYAQFLGLDYTCVFSEPNSELNLIELRNVMLSNFRI